MYRSYTRYFLQNICISMFLICFIGIDLCYAQDIMVRGIEVRQNRNTLIPEPNSEIPLYYILEALPNPIGKITDIYLSDPKINSLFVPLSKINYSSLSGGIWLRFSVQGNAIFGKHLFLNLGSYGAFPISVYRSTFQDSKSTFEKLGTYETARINLQTADTKQNAHYTYYILLPTIPSPLFSPIIENGSSIANLVSIIQIVCFGLLLVVIVFSLLRAILQKKTLFLLTPFFSSCILITLLFGMPNTTFGFISIQSFPTILSAIFAIVTFPLFSLFAITRNGEILQRVQKHIVLGITCVAIGIAIIPLIPKMAFIIRYFPFWPILLLLSFPIALYTLQKGYTNALLYLIGCIAPTVSLGLTAIFSFLYIDAFFYVEVLPIIGLTTTALSITFFSIPFTFLHDKTIPVHEHKQEESTPNWMHSLDNPKESEKSVSSKEIKEEDKYLEDSIETEEEYDVPTTVKERIVEAMNREPNIILYSPRELFIYLYRALKKFSENYNVELSWFVDPDLDENQEHDSDVIYNTLYSIGESLIINNPNSNMHISAKKIADINLPSHIRFSITITPENTLHNFNSNSIADIAELISLAGGTLFMGNAQGKKMEMIITLPAVAKLINSDITPKESDPYYKPINKNAEAIYAVMDNELEHYEESNNNPLLKDLQKSIEEVLPSEKDNTSYEVNTQSVSEHIDEEQDYSIENEYSEVTPPNRNYDEEYIQNEESRIEEEYISNDLDDRVESIDNLEHTYSDSIIENNSIMNDDYDEEYSTEEEQKALRDLRNELERLTQEQYKESYPIEENSPPTQEIQILGNNENIYNDIEEPGIEDTIHDIQAHPTPSIMPPITKMPLPKMDKYGNEIHHKQDNIPFPSLNTEVISEDIVTAPSIVKYGPEKEKNSIPDYSESRRIREESIDTTNKLFSNGIQDTDKLEYPILENRIGLDESTLENSSMDTETFIEQTHYNEPIYDTKNTTQLGQNFSTNNQAFIEQTHYNEPIYDTKNTTQLGQNSSTNNQTFIEQTHYNEPIYDTKNTTQLGENFSTNNQAFIEQTHYNEPIYDTKNTTQLGQNSSTNNQAFIEQTHYNEPIYDTKNTTQLGENFSTNNQAFIEQTHYNEPIYDTKNSVPSHMDTTYTEYNTFEEASYQKQQEIELNERNREQQSINNSILTEPEKIIHVNPVIQENRQHNPAYEEMDTLPKMTPSGIQNDSHSYYAKMNSITPEYQAVNIADFIDDIEQQPIPQKQQTSHYNDAGKNKPSMEQHIPYTEHTNPYDDTLLLTNDMAIDQTAYRPIHNDISTSKKLTQKPSGQSNDAIKNTTPITTNNVEGTNETASFTSSIRSSVQELLDARVQAEWEEIVPVFSDRSSIIIMDNNANNRKLLLYFLEGLDYTIADVETAHQLLKQHAHYPAHLIVVDIDSLELPVSDVVNELHKIDKRYGEPSVMVVAITSNHSPNLTNSGVVAILNKPVNHAEFRGLLLKLLPERVVNTGRTAPQWATEEDEITPMDFNKVTIQPVVTENPPTITNKPRYVAPAVVGMNVETTQAHQSEQSISTQIQEEAIQNNSMVKKDASPNPFTTVTQEKALKAIQEEVFALPEYLYPAIPQFLTMLQQNMHTAEGALRIKDYYKIIDIANKLATECRRFSLPSMEKIAQCIERAAQEQDESAVGILFEELANTMDIAVSLLVQQYETIQ